MKRKTYYTILSIGLFLPLLYFLLFEVVFRSLGAKPDDYFTIVDAIVLFILLYETMKAPRTRKILCLICFPFVFIGFAFVVLHWPFGLFILLAPSFMITVSLLINNSKNTANKILHYFLLCIPLLYMLIILSVSLELPAVSFFVGTHFLLMNTMGIFLVVQLIRKRMA